MRAGGLLLLLVVAPAAEQRYFQYERPVVRDANVAGQSCVALDPAVFAHAAPGLGDLRLYRDTEKLGSEEIPYVVRRVEAVQSSVTAETLLNRGTRDGHVVFDVAMPEGRYKDLDLAVEKRDFLATVTVMGSDVQGAMGTKLGDYTIFDLTAQGLGRSTVLHLPESDFRYLHFSVAGPLEAKEFTSLAVVRRPAAEARFVTVARTSAVAQQGQDTVLTLTVGAGVPVDRVVMEPGTKPVEFKRDVTATTVAGNSRSEAVGQFWRMHRKVADTAIDEQNFTLLQGGTAEAVPRMVTVAIHNGSDAPLSIQSARLEMVERDLCFNAQAGAEYALYYGDAALEAPSYDYARLFAAEAHPAMVRLGAEARNVRYEARPDARPFTERHRWLLWLALAVVIALLALVALRTAKTALPPVE